MIIIKTQKEFDDMVMVKDGVFKVNDNVTFECNIVTNVGINAWDITAWNITAWNITAWDITAWDITAWNIDASGIKARDITAGNITAGNIDARGIDYYAFCIAYKTFKCKSIIGRRENSIHKCLDNEIEYIENDKDKQIKKYIENKKCIENEVKEIENKVQNLKEEVNELKGIKL